MLKLNKNLWQTAEHAGMDGMVTGCMNDLF